MGSSVKTTQAVVGRVVAVVNHYCRSFCCACGMHALCAAVLLVIPGTVIELEPDCQLEGATSGCDGCLAESSLKRRQVVRYGRQACSFDRPTIKTPSRRSGCKRHPVGVADEGHRLVNGLLAPLIC